MTERRYVWDRFVRLFHWSLVLLFCTSYLTGEDETALHIYSGYAIVALLAARILWGFVGTRHARFADFLFRPATIIDYSKSLLAGKPKRYLGHNPLGGPMVVAMLASLLVTTLSGLQLYAVEEGKGPFADAGGSLVVSRAYASDDDEYESHDAPSEEAEENEELWEEIHEAGVNLLLILIALHVGGVLVSSRLEGESLIKAMLTGYKEGNKRSGG